VELYCHILPLTICNCNPRFFNPGEEMKKLTSGVFFVALACLICLFVPCAALAQDGGTDPCCYRAPAGQAPIVIERSSMLIEVPLAAMAQVPGRMLRAASATAANPMDTPAIIEQSWLLNNRRQF
jgi:hypothetical protein